jgi:GMP synthase-like glutamine amidotransferase
VPEILFVRCDRAETFGVGGGGGGGAGGGRPGIWNAIDAGEPSPSLDDVDGVVVFGSTFNVEHADEQPFIKETAELMRESIVRRIPVLGVCFGGQLLAWALDAEVGKGPVREVGFEPIHPTPAATHDLLFSHLTDGDMTFQWHMDTFALPDGAELLATGDRVANQAFRYGDLAWGTQFHCEVNRAEIESWLGAFARRGDLLTEWGKSPEQVREQMVSHIDAHETRGREIFERFANVAAGS